MDRPDIFEGHCSVPCPKSSLNAISSRQCFIEDVGVDLPFEANLFQSFNPVMREIFWIFGCCSRVHVAVLFPQERMAVHGTNGLVKM